MNDEFFWSVVAFWWDVCCPLWIKLIDCCNESIVGIGVKNQSTLAKIQIWYIKAVEGRQTNPKKTRLSQSNIRQRSKQGKNTQEHKVIWYFFAPRLKWRSHHRRSFINLKCKSSKLTQSEKPTTLFLFMYFFGRFVLMICYFPHKLLWLTQLKSDLGCDGAGGLQTFPSISYTWGWSLPEHKVWYTVYFQFVTF